MSRLKELYQKDVIPKMKEKFGFKNDLAVPRLEKIVVNVGIKSETDPKFHEVMKDTLAVITGQKPIETKAKKAIAGFKIKKGQKIGLKVTLRGDRMYDFLDKLINIVLPRTRDFKGVSSAFDGRGNLSMGFKEQIAFPEIEEGTDKTFGLEITISTNAKKDQEAKELLRFLGMPFKE
jgi:large subunit ribosomal protein L5